MWRSTTTARWAPRNVKKRCLGWLVGLAVCIFATANGRNNNNNNNKGNTVNLSAINHLKCGLLPIGAIAEATWLCHPSSGEWWSRGWAWKCSEMANKRSIQQGSGEKIWKKQPGGCNCSTSLTAFTVGLTLEKTGNYADCCCRISLTLDGKATHGKCFWNWIALGGPSGW